MHSLKRSRVLIVLDDLVVVLRHVATAATETALSTLALIPLVILPAVAAMGSQPVGPTSNADAPGLMASKLSGLTGAGSFGLFPRISDANDEVDWSLETRGPRGWIMAIAWSPNGNQLAFGESTGVVRIYETKSWQLVGLLVGHDESVHDVAWSPDGRWLATLSRDKALRIWQADGTPVATSGANAALVRSISWSPDSRLLSSCMGRQVAIWDRNADLRRTWKAHQNFVLHTDWCPDGKRIASASNDGTVRVWDLSGARQVKPEPGKGADDAEWLVPSTIAQRHGANVAGLCWCPDGERLASIDEQGDLRIWPAMQKPAVTHRHELARAMDLAWSPDGQCLASTGAKSIRFWTSEGKPSRDLPLRDLHPYCLTWSPDSQRLGVAMSPDDVFLCVVDRKGAASRVIKGYKTSEHRRRPVVWTPNGKSLTSASRDAWLRYWRTEGAPGPSWRPPGRRLDFLVATPDRRLIATYSFGDAAVRFWNNDGRAGPVRQPLGVRSMAWSPSGNLLAVGPTNGLIQLVNNDGTTENTLEAPRTHITGLYWSPDGLRLALTVPEEASVFVGHVKSTEWTVMQGQASSIRSVAWHPEADRLAAIDLDGQVYSWHTDDPQPRLWYRHSGQGKAVSWSPDGRWLASAGKGICFMTPDGKVACRVAPAEVYFGNGLRWSPDGKWLAAQGHNHSIYLCKPDGTIGPVLIGENLESASLTWRDDGQQIACTTYDNTVIVWNSADGTTQWVGYALPDGKAAVVTHKGQLVTDHDATFHERFVFVRRLNDGRVLLSDPPFSTWSRPCR